MREIERLKEEILNDSARLYERNSFTFARYPSPSCFGNSCDDVNIFQTLNDIIRLRSRLGISSGELLSKYTARPFGKNLKYPVTLLKMKMDDRERCAFVERDGCRVYEARPWFRGRYLVGPASPKVGSDFLNGEFYFLLEE